MKKIVLFTFLLIFVCFVPNIVYGQTPFPTIDPIIIGDVSDSIPVLSCGVAGDTTGRDKCCYTAVNSQCSSSLLDLAIKMSSMVPPLQEMIKNGVEKCEKIKKFAIDSNGTPCIVGDPTIAGQLTNNFSDPSCKCVNPHSNVNLNTAMVEMCYKYLGSSTFVNDLAECAKCASQNGMWTGMGCLSLDLGTLIGGFVLTSGIGIGGGFALLCIIYAAFMMQSSEGNPEKLKKAQEMITSCIMGLMLIIFSVFILKIIGVNIIRIPGFQ